MDDNQALEKRPDQQIDQVDEREVLAQMRRETRARATALFHGPGMSRLGGMLESPDDKTALGAIQMLGKISGDLKSGPSVEVKLSFEEMRAQQKPEPLADLFEIHGQVIEGDVDLEEEVEDGGTDK